MRAVGETLPHRRRGRVGRAGFQFVTASVGGTWAIVLLALLAPLVAVAEARASQRTFTLRTGPYRVAPFQTVLPKHTVPRPPRAGWITGMHARTVDRRGRRVTLRSVMLHHVVFSNLSSRTAGRRCENRGGETFYGTGEENQALDLPAGYGYRLRRRDRWRMAAMLMSHSRRPQTVYIQYRVTVERAARRPVRPFWIRASGCQRAAAYNISGDGPPGFVADRIMRWPVPFDARIVAAGGHLHGGAIDLRMTQPGCGGRTLFHNRPAFGAANHLVYRVRPVLHEVGPIATSWFSSRTGIPVRRGETLELHGLYDGAHPHAGVMAITHLYLARGPAPRATCPELPADRRQTRPPVGARTAPPWATVPLFTLDGHRIVRLPEPSGPTTPLDPGAAVTIRDGGFSPRKVVIPRAATIRFRWAGRAAHNLKFANGPRPVGSPVRPRGSVLPRTFETAGRYQLFCSRHPLTMHAQVTVRP